MHQTSVLFVSSHLAAFQNDVENRNRCIMALYIKPVVGMIFARRDYRTISAGLRVNPLEPGVESCESHHCCIWMGDLNYRFLVFFLFSSASFVFYLFLWRLLTGSITE